MTLQQEIRTEALVFPVNEATIVPKISAPVEQFYVNRGDRVRAGQLVAVLDNQDLKAAVAEAKGAYEQAQANYQNATAAQLPVQLQTAERDVENARSAFQAAQHLYESDTKLYQQGAIAQQQLENARTGMVQAKTALSMAEQQLEKLQTVGKGAQIKAAQGQLDSAKGKYEAAKADLAYSEVRSPIAGIVTDRPYYPGATANAGAPLMTVMDLSVVVARAHVPQAQAELLKTGDAAEIGVAGKKLPGKVTLVSPALDPGSTTVEVWIQASNLNQELKPGATVQVEIVSKRVPDAVTVPESAVVSVPGEPRYVLVIGTDGRVHQREVGVGIQDRDRVQITKGLAEGELVVSAGAYGLRDGVKVRVENSSG